ncbi:hypothetical protein [Mangrovibacterium sp.]|uniref:hypothetical protein n=1 Tax=Mangrovibacterium sp. TaxID=1961364 RepID=UPI0035641228
MMDLVFKNRQSDRLLNLKGNLVEIYLKIKVDISIYQGADFFNFQDTSIYTI